MGVQLFAGKYFKVRDKLTTTKSNQKKPNSKKQEYPIKIYIQSKKQNEQISKSSANLSFSAKNLCYFSISKSKQQLISKQAKQ